MAEKEPIRRPLTISINEADRRISIVSVDEKKQVVDDDVEFSPHETDAWIFFKSITRQSKQIVKDDSIRYDLLHPSHPRATHYDMMKVVFQDSITNPNRLVELYSEVQGLLGPHGSLIERVTKDEQGREVSGFRMTAPVFVVKNAETS